MVSVLASSSMIASLGKQTLKEGNDSITIDYVTSEAEDFYTEKCGFIHFNDDSFKLDKRHIKKLIKKIQKETKSTIIDLQS